MGWHGLMNLFCPSQKTTLFVRYKQKFLDALDGFFDNLMQAMARIADRRVRPKYK
jgi:hypothetical protein